MIYRQREAEAASAGWKRVPAAQAGQTASFQAKAGTPATQQHPPTQAWLFCLPAGVPVNLPTSHQAGKPGSIGSHRGSFHSGPLSPLLFHLSNGATGGSLGRGQGSRQGPTRSEGKNTAFLFFFFLPFRAIPATYGGSHARGQIGATATATATGTQDLSHICNLHHSSRRQILNPLSEARD